MDVSLTDLADPARRTGKIQSARRRSPATSPTASATEEALQKQTERLRLLWEAAAVLLTADDPDAMLRGLLAKIGPHLGVDTYFNYVVDDSGDALRLASCEGVSDETARTIARLEFGQAICGTVALHRRPIVATHIQQSDDPKAQLRQVASASGPTPAIRCWPATGCSARSLRQPDEGRVRRRTKWPSWKPSATTSPSPTSGCGCWTS